MSKTLTEQWRDGTLPCGAYYVNRLGETRIYFVRYEDNKNTHEIYEVLAPVPSYDKVKEMCQKIERLEFDNEALEMAHNEGKEINAELVSKNEQLEKQLEIATKALKEYADSSNWYETDDFGISAIDQFACDDYGYNIAKTALEEMEGVK